MVQRVRDRIEQHAQELATLASENEELGRLSDRTTRILRESELMRLLQPKDWGGHEAHPREFAEAVMAVGCTDGSSGWVSGVVGVHPWEVALFDPRVGDEIWGEDQSTWIASPYTPTGVAEPVDGGYLLSGRWQFSSGTDHCDWVFLGALLGDGTGKPLMPPKSLHVILPRADYEILADSWRVMGLSGTGSKDLVVRDAFVPEYRAVAFADIVSGSAAARLGRDQALYRIPFWVMFPLGITASIVGMAEGALAAHIAYQRERVNAAGARVRDDPHSAFAMADAAAEIGASRLQLLDGISRVYDRVEAGETIGLEGRSDVRRNQIRCAWRAVGAIDEIFARSGGTAIRLDNPLQRFFRDAHAGLQHMVHSPNTINHSNSLLKYGVEPPPPLLITI